MHKGIRRQECLTKGINVPDSEAGWLIEGEHINNWVKQKTTKSILNQIQSKNHRLIENKQENDTKPKGWKYKKRIEKED